MGYVLNCILAASFFWGFDSRAGEAAISFTRCLLCSSAAAEAYSS